MIKLFAELKVSDIFYFYQNPEKKYIKFDRSHYVHSSGVIRRVDPFIAVFIEPQIRSTKSILDQRKGDPNV